jgi:L-lactate dehydrogenase complex protein LldF
VQVAGERPYHIVTPAMHKSKTDVAKLFNEKFDLPLESTPQEITEYVRQVLRKKYTTADIGVIGANFIIADIGGIAVTENEGNALMSTAFPKIHIVFAGIEKIIPSIDDLGVFWPLLACMGTGQQITAYNSIFTGPKKGNETDGPEKMYVILLDNGRSNIYEDTEVSDVLSCIRCGACLNACPVYKTIGGYTYEATYSGPIGSVITPFFKGFKDFGHLSSASSLCGACAEVCPQKIPLPDLLLVNRRKSVEKNLRPIAEKVSIKIFSKISQSRFFFNLPGILKNIALHPFNYTLWGPKRKMPSFSSASFSQQWKKLKKKQ